MRFTIPYRFWGVDVIAWPAVIAKPERDFNQRCHLSEMGELWLYGVRAFIFLDTTKSTFH